MMRVTYLSILLGLAFIIGATAPTYAEVERTCDAPPEYNFFRAPHLPEEGAFAVETQEEDGSNEYLRTITIQLTGCGDRKDFHATMKAVDLPWEAGIVGVYILPFIATPDRPLHFPEKVKTATYDVALRVGWEWYNSYIIFNADNGYAEEVRFEIDSEYDGIANVMIDQVSTTYEIVTSGIRNIQCPKNMKPYGTFPEVHDSPMGRGAVVISPGEICRSSP